MAGKIYLTLLILGIIFEFILLISSGLDNAIYGTTYFGIVAIIIGVNIQINLIKLSKLSKKAKSEMPDKKMIARNSITSKKISKTLNEKERIAVNKELLRYFLLALILFGLSTLLIFK